MDIEQNLPPRQETQRKTPAEALQQELPKKTQEEEPTDSKRSEEQAPSPADAAILPKNAHLRNKNRKRKEEKK